MSQYDNYRDDEIIDQIDRNYPSRDQQQSVPEGIGTGFGIGALLALAIILVVAWNSGFVEIQPYQGTTNVTDLPISPTVVPTTPPAVPRT